MAEKPALGVGGLGKAWFATFRFYGPLEPYFDKSWPLPDIELLK